MKRDKERGVTYESGIAMKNSIPPEVEKEDRKRKRENNVECPFPGCYEPKHKRRSSQKCTYHGVCKESLQASIESRLENVFPSYYGECLDFVSFCSNCCFICFFVFCFFVKALAFTVVYVYYVISDI